MAGIQSADSLGAEPGGDADLVGGQCRVNFIGQTALVLLAGCDQVQAGEGCQAMRIADRVALLGNGASLTDNSFKAVGGPCQWLAIATSGDESDRIAAAEEYQRQLLIALDLGTVGQIVVYCLCVRCDSCLIQEIPDVGIAVDGIGNKICKNLEVLVVNRSQAGVGKLIRDQGNILGISVANVAQRKTMAEQYVVASAEKTVFPETLSLGTLGRGPVEAGTVCALAFVVD